MTELEKMQRAKMYIDKLANGINPLDDMPASDTDIINNVRLSRCLFYVSDILRRVIDNGGEVGTKKKIPRTKKLPYDVTADELSKFEFSTKPIPASEIAKRLTDLIDENIYQKMSYRAITDWLLQIGMLEMSNLPSGKTTKRPTAQGNDIGIDTEIRDGRNGPYTVVVYDLEAQQFVVDNIVAIIEMGK